MSKKTDAQIKAESDARRAKRAKRDIRIHAGSIEDRGETRKKLEKEKVKVVPTGYRTRVRLTWRESRWNWLREAVNVLLGWTQRDGIVARPKHVQTVEMKRNHVEMKVVTRCIAWFKDKRSGRMFCSYPPLREMNRQSIDHVERKKLWWLSRYAYMAEMDKTPTSAMVMLEMGINPEKRHSVELDLVEMTGKDEYYGKNLSYRLMMPGEKVEEEAQG